MLRLRGTVFRQISPRRTPADSNHAGHQPFAHAFPASSTMRYRRFRAESGSSDRYPRQESISGISGAVAASRHKLETAWLKEYSSAPGYHILLSHHPEYLPLIPSSIELVFSGHAHGGQWRVFNHGAWAPGQGWWPRYTKGVYKGRLVVSAGLSNTTWVPRIWNPTEIVYLEP